MNATSTLGVSLKQIEDWIEPAGVAGASVTVRLRGDEVATHVAGEAVPGLPVSRETLFGLASVSKPVTAALVMTLVDDGLVSLKSLLLASYLSSVHRPRLAPPNGKHPEDWLPSGRPWHT